MNLFLPSKVFSPCPTKIGEFSVTSIKHFVVNFNSPLKLDMVNQAPTPQATPTHATTKVNVMQNTGKRLETDMHDLGWEIQS